MRKLITRLVSSVVAVGLAAGLAVAGAGTASADGPYNLVTNSAGGFGTADGWVDFKSRQRVEHDGVVEDYCDGQGQGDGYAPSLRTRVLFANGSYAAWYPWRGDTRGCTATGGVVVFGNHIHPDRTILRLEVQLCLRKDDGYTKGCVLKSFLNQHA